MNEKHITKIAEELTLKPPQVLAAATLLDDGATVPFIARYRKETTGSLDEVAITAVRDRLHQLQELDKRRESTLKSLAERELLNDELREEILNADTLAVLEDIYLPYRPKRRTRATVAKERGLEPLALKIFSQEETVNPLEEAQAFVDPKREVHTIEDALAGARHIIAEWVNENQEARAKMRILYTKKAVFCAKVVTSKEAEASKYRDYFDLKEPAENAPSHRILAMRRGEKEGFLTLRVQPPEDEALAILENFFVKGDGAAIVLQCVDAKRGPRIGVKRPTGRNEKHFVGDQQTFVLEVDGAGLEETQSGRHVDDAAVCDVQRADSRGPRTDVNSVSGPERADARDGHIAVTAPSRADVCPVTGQPAAANVKCPGGGRTDAQHPAHGQLLAGCHRMAA